jgi:hypothetical protein
MPIIRENVDTESNSLLINAQPVTVAERSKACTVFARSEVGIVGLNPIQGMDVWCLCVCVCVCVCVGAFFCVCVQVVRPCNELITCPRSPTEYLRSSKPKCKGEFHGGRPRLKLGL